MLDGDEFEDFESEETKKLRTNILELVDVCKKMSFALA